MRHTEKAIAGNRLHLPSRSLKLLPMLGVVPVSLPSREMPAALAASTAGLRPDRFLDRRGGERIPGTRDDCRRAAAAAATVGALKTLAVGDAEAEADEDDGDGDSESAVDRRDSR